MKEHHSFRTDVLSNTTRERADAWLIGVVAFRLEPVFVEIEG